MNILLCPLSDPGYLYPSLRVGIELRLRGNTVSVLGNETAAAATAAAGLDLIPADQVGDPAAFFVKTWGFHGLNQFQAVCRAAKSVRADLLVTSVLCQGALLAAEVLDLPVVVMGFAAHLWRYQSGADEEPATPADRLWRENIMLANYTLTRDQIGLAPRRDPQPQRALIGSGLLLRGHPDLEHPGAVLPAGIHHAGPCLWEPPPDPGEAADIAAALDRVGKPVVYVHLGRIFDGGALWPRLNSAFTDGPFQAVVELGRTGRPQPDARADLLVVRKPWMGPLVERAELVLTNATSAPVLMGLSHGRPLVVAPAGSEQPLLAEACLKAGVAVRFPSDLLDDGAAVLKAARVDPAVQSRVAEIGAELSWMDRSGRTADLIEAAASGDLTSNTFTAVAALSG